METVCAAPNMQAGAFFLAWALRRLGEAPSLTLERLAICFWGMLSSSAGARSSRGANIRVLPG